MHKTLKKKQQKECGKEVKGKGKRKTHCTSYANYELRETLKETGAKGKMH